MSADFDEGNLPRGGHDVRDPTMNAVVVAVAHLLIEDRDLSWTCLQEGIRRHAIGERDTAGIVGHGRQRRASREHLRKERARILVPPNLHHLREGVVRSDPPRLPCVVWT